MLSRLVNRRWEWHVTSRARWPRSQGRKVGKSHWQYSDGYIQQNIAETAAVYKEQDELPIDTDGMFHSTKLLELPLHSTPKCLLVAVFHPLQGTGMFLWQ